jgi:hypothetical protein
LIIDKFGVQARTANPKSRSEQKSLEVPLHQTVAAIEKEVQSLKAELAALRAQIQRSDSPPTPVAPGNGSRPNGPRPSRSGHLLLLRDSYGSW